MEDYKANVNIIDDSGKTPLHWACKFGLLTICKFLCKYLVDKNTLDKNRKTPLDMAVSEHKWEIVWFLEDTYRENWNFENFYFHIGITFFLYFINPTFDPTNPD